MAGRPARPAGLPTETEGCAPEPGYYEIVAIIPEAPPETLIVEGTIAPAEEPTDEQPVVAGEGEGAVGTE